MHALQDGNVPMDLAHRQRDRHQPNLCRNPGRFPFGCPDVIVKHHERELYQEFSMAATIVWQRLSPGSDYSRDGNPIVELKKGMYS